MCCDPFGGEHQTLHGKDERMPAHGPLPWLTPTGVRAHLGYLAETPNSQVSPLKKGDGL